MSKNTKIRIRINDDFEIRDDKGMSWMLIHTTRGVNRRTGKEGIGQHRTYHPNLEFVREALLEKGCLESDADSLLAIIEQRERLHSDFIDAIRSINPETWVKIPPNRILSRETRTKHPEFNA